MAALILGLGIILGGCNGGSGATSSAPITGSDTQAVAVTPTPAPTPAHVYNAWQNPFLSSNPWNNVHSDSYMTDTFPQAGPTVAKTTQVSQVGDVTFLDPTTGLPRSVRLGECAAQAFDAQGNIQTVSGGVETPGATSVTRSIVTLDAKTLRVLAWTSFEKPLDSNTGTGIDFGGAGYFCQDDQYRMVVALPSGHVQVLRRTPSAVGGVDGYTPDRDVNITGTGGVIPVPTGLKSLSLYAVVPDKAGNIWFTVSEGMVGTITPAGAVHWINLNDPTSTGVQQGDERIANSHAIDEGDAGGPSGMYVASTYKQYRFSAAADGSITMDWSMAYDRGTAQKSGQVSFGTGTTPTVFRIGNRRFVTIADNATPMHINVYRAEATLLPGEQRLFAQIAPFGANPWVSDENSLIVAPRVDGTIDIYAENNWGNVGPLSTLGERVTEPGFARCNLKADGTFTVASVNSTIAVPSLVSKMSTGSDTVYTYWKKPDGWYLVGVDANDLNVLRFSTYVGPGEFRFNNFYAALAIDPTRPVCYIGTFLGLTRVELNP